MKYENLKKLAILVTKHIYLKQGIAPSCTPYLDQKNVKLPKHETSLFLLFQTILLGEEKIKECAQSVI